MANFLRGIKTICMTDEPGASKPRPAKDSFHACYPANAPGPSVCGSRDMDFYENLRLHRILVEFPFCSEKPTPE